MKTETVILTCAATLISLAGCSKKPASPRNSIGQAQETSAEMDRVGTRSRHSSTIDANGMGVVNQPPSTTNGLVPVDSSGTVSGTTQSGPAPTGADPLAASTDSRSNEASQGKSVEQSTRVTTKKKLDASRPGTERDTGGGNDSQTGAKSK